MRAKKSKTKRREREEEARGRLSKQNDLTTNDSYNQIEIVQRMLF